MTCAACVSSVEKAVCSLDGVESASVSLMTNSLDIIYDDSLLSPNDIINAVKNKGYSAKPYTRMGDDSTESSDIMRLRLIISLIFLLPLSYVSMGKMVGLALPSFLSDNAILSGVIQFGLCLPIIAVNYKFFTVGFKRLFKLDPNMDSLIAIGSASSLIYSLYAFFKIVSVPGSSHHLYVDSAAMILTLITLGKFLEARARKKTSKALHGIAELSPEYATIIVDGDQKTIPTSELKIGDIVLVRPGQNLPADGTITKGSPSINCAVITGESLPVELNVGDSVSAGTTNLNAPFEFKVTQKGEMTTLGKMIALVEDAAASKAPIARLADKVASIFVPVVIVLSLIGATVWFFITRDLETALSAGISVLVIACPCSLGLATPTAIIAGTGRSAQFGVLFRSAEALEALAKTDTVVLDKTGTITSGDLSVNHVIVQKDELSPRSIVQKKEDSDRLLALVAALESHSEHPIAKAICKKAEDMSLNIPSVDSQITAMPGYGIKGTVDHEDYIVGNGAICENVSIPEATQEIIQTLECSGNTVVRIIKNNEFIGLIALADRIRADSHEAIKFIKDIGITPIMITGDNIGAATEVARSVGIASFSAEAKPGDKELAVRKLKAAGHTVVMIGDGVNDAPAIASADVGVAIGSGTDIAIESSDVVLIGGRLGDFCNALTVSKSTMRVIRQNLFWAFFYNCIGIGLALFNLASPMVASIAMSLSSLCVVSNALRLRKIKLKKVIAEVNNSSIPMKKNNTKTNIKEIKQMKKEIIIEGMMCMHCSGRVEKVLNAIDGVEAKVDLEKKTAFVTCPDDLDVEILSKTVTDAGYTVIEIK